MGTITTELSFRPAVPADAEKLQLLYGRNKLYLGNVPHSLDFIIETNILSIVCEDSSGIIQGFVSITDDLEMIECRDVIASLAEVVSNATVTTGNCLFIETLAILNDSLKETVSFSLLQQVFTQFPYLDHLSYLSTEADIFPTSLFAVYFHKLLSGVPLDTFDNVFLCPRNPYVPTLMVRPTKAEDNDDLVPVLRNEFNDDGTRFNEFFVSEMVEHQTDDQKIFTGIDPNGKAVALLSTSTEAPLAQLQLCYDLSPFGNLVKPSDELKRLDARKLQLEARMSLDWIKVNSENMEELQAVFDSIPSFVGDELEHHKSASSILTKGNTPIALCSDDLSSETSSILSEGNIVESKHMEGNDQYFDYDDGNVQVLLKDVASTFNERGDAWNFAGPQSQGLGDAMLYDIGAVPLISVTSSLSSLRSALQQREAALNTPISRSDLNSAVDKIQQQREANLNRLLVAHWYHSAPGAAARHENLASRFQKMEQEQRSRVQQAHHLAADEVTRLKQLLEKASAELRSTIESTAQAYAEKEGFVSSGAAAASEAQQGSSTEWYSLGTGAYANVVMEDRKVRRRVQAVEALEKQLEQCMQQEQSSAVAATSTTRVPLSLLLDSLKSTFQKDVESSFEEVQMGLRERDAAVLALAQANAGQQGVFYSADEIVGLNADVQESQTNLIIARVAHRRDRREQQLLQLFCDQLMATFHEIYPTLPATGGDWTSNPPSKIRDEEMEEVEEVLSDADIDLSMANLPTSSSTPSGMRGKPSTPTSAAIENDPNAIFHVEGLTLSEFVKLLDDFERQVVAPALAPVISVSSSLSSLQQNDRDDPSQHEEHLVDIIRELQLPTEQTEQELAEQLGRLCGKPVVNLRELFKSLLQQFQTKEIAVREALEERARARARVQKFEEDLIKKGLLTAQDVANSNATANAGSTGGKITPAIQAAKALLALPEPSNELLNPLVYPIDAIEAFLTSELAVNPLSTGNTSNVPVGSGAAAARGKKNAPSPLLTAAAANGTSVEEEPVGIDIERVNSYLLDPMEFNYDEFELDEECKLPVDESQHSILSGLKSLDASAGSPLPNWAAHVNEKYREGVIICGYPLNFPGFVTSLLDRLDARFMRARALTVHLADRSHPAIAPNMEEGEEHIESQKNYLPIVSKSHLHGLSRVVVWVDPSLQHAPAPHHTPLLSLADSLANALLVNGLILKDPLRLEYKLERLLRYPSSRSVLVQRCEPNAFMIHTAALAPRACPRVRDLLLAAFEAHPDFEYCVYLQNQQDASALAALTAEGILPPSRPGASLRSVALVIPKSSLLAPVFANVRRATVEDLSTIAHFARHSVDPRGFLDASVRANQLSHLPIVSAHQDSNSLTHLAPMALFVLELNGESVGAAVLSAGGASSEALRILSRTCDTDAVFNHKYYGVSSSALCLSDRPANGAAAASLLHFSLNSALTTHSAFYMRLLQRRFMRSRLLLYRVRSEDFNGALHLPIPLQVSRAFALLRPLRTPEYDVRGRRQYFESVVTERRGIIAGRCGILGIPNPFDDVDVGYFHDIPRDEWHIHASSDEPGASGANSSSFHLPLRNEQREKEKELKYSYVYPFHADNDPLEVPAAAPVKQAELRALLRPTEAILALPARLTGVGARVSIYRRVVVVGSSDSAISAISSLLCAPNVHFPSITLVSPDGLPPIRDPFSLLNLDFADPPVAEEKSDNSHNLHDEKSDKMLQDERLMMLPISARVDAFVRRVEASLWTKPLGMTQSLLHARVRAPGDASLHLTHSHPLVETVRESTAVSELEDGKMIEFPVPPAPLAQLPLSDEEMALRNVGSSPSLPNHFPFQAAREMNGLLLSRVAISSLITLVLDDISAVSVEECTLWLSTPAAGSGNNIASNVAARLPFEMLLLAPDLVESGVWSIPESAAASNTERSIRPLVPPMVALGCHSISGSSALDLLEADVGQWLRREHSRLNKGNGSESMSAEGSMEDLVSPHSPSPQGKAGFRISLGADSPMVHVPEASGSPGSAVQLASLSGPDALATHSHEFDQHSAPEALRYLFQKDQIIVFGDSVNALATIAALISRGVPPSRILYITDPPAPQDHPFSNVRGLPDSLFVSNISGGAGSVGKRNGASMIDSPLQDSPLIEETLSHDSLFEEDTNATRNAAVDAHRTNEQVIDNETFDASEIYDSPDALNRCLFPEAPTPLSPSSLYAARTSAALLRALGVRRLVRAHVSSIDGLENDHRQTSAEGTPVGAAPGMVVRVTLAPPVTAEAAATGLQSNGSSSNLNNASNFGSFIHGWQGIDSAPSSANLTARSQLNMNASRKDKALMELNSLLSERPLQLVLHCSLLLSVGVPDVPRRFFDIVNSAGIVFDGRLVVSNTFKTSVDNVWACGACSKFSRRYRIPQVLDPHVASITGTVATSDSQIGEESAQLATLSDLGVYDAVECGEKVAEVLLQDSIRASVRVASSQQNTLNTTTKSLSTVSMLHRDLRKLFTTPYASINPSVDFPFVNDLNEPSSSKDAEYLSLPVFQKPKVLSAVLPGPLFLLRCRTPLMQLHLRSSPVKIDMINNSSTPSDPLNTSLDSTSHFGAEATAVELSDPRDEVITHVEEEHVLRHCRALISRDKMLCEFEYVGSDIVEPVNLSVLNGMPVVLLNSLVKGVESGDIDDLIEHFRADWCSALYSPLFPRLKALVMAAAGAPGKEDKELRDRMLTTLLQFLQEYIDVFPRYLVN